MSVTNRNSARVPSLFVVLACVVPALLALSCKEEILVSSQEALVDPRFSPRVVATNPPMNSVGPYAQWSGYQSRSYAITIRFNKLMDPASVRNGLGLSSTMRTLHFQGVPAPLPSDPEKFTESFTFYPADSAGFDYPRIGEVMTLSVVHPIVDVNGNVLPPGVLGSFEPETVFRLLGTSPEDGGIIGYPGGGILLAFNSKVDSSILPFLTINPPAGYAPIFQWDSTQIWIPASSLTPASSFALTLAAGARDADGHVLGSAFSAVFHFDTFHRASAYYPNDTTAVVLYKSFYLPMSLPVDTSTLRGAFHITPDVEDALLLSVSGSTITIEPGEDYDPLTRYRVTVDTTLRSVLGSALDVPYAFSFTTDSFRVSYSYPYNGNTQVYRSTSVRIEFTGRLDVSSVAAAFSISPSVSGATTYLDGPPRLTLIPAGRLDPLTRYSVRVDTSLRSMRGVRLARPFAFSFTTGSN